MQPVASAALEPGAPAQIGLPPPERLCSFPFLLPSGNLAPCALCHATPLPQRLLLCRVRAALTRAAA